MRRLAPALKREYEHRQKTWVAEMLRIAAGKDFEMARGKGRPVSEAPDGNMPVFVNCTMPTTERVKVKKFAEDAEKLWQLNEQLMLDGYKVTWSFDKSRGGFACSLTCKDPESTNFGKTLSAWSSGWFDALAALLYKHFVYLSQDWNMALSVKSEDVFG